ncbi:MAG: FAD-dependent oxidoreductase [Pseudomonadota bacterium]|nr:FAD-dependent oxidoreductase [Pseudomonadota bacterium]
MTILSSNVAAFNTGIDVLIVGGGGCGLTAALSVDLTGSSVMVLEKDSSALGTTSMSTGLIPGAGSRFQKELNIKDSPEAFFDDIKMKTQGQTDLEIAAHLANQSALTVEWLVDSCNVPLSLVSTFDYPGHSNKRMHGSPNRTGSELMGALHDTIALRDIPVVTEANVINLFVDEYDVVKGARVYRKDSGVEDISCKSLILACCGFGGNKKMLEEYIPEIVDADFFGHPGNKGDAVKWGTELNAAIGDIHSYQGHGGLAYGNGVPILWAHIMEGGFQVNSNGERFSNEAKGYSEQAKEILNQPNNFAWSIYDKRCHDVMKEFDDYHDALKANCVLEASNIQDLLRVTKLPKSLERTIDEVKDLTLGIKEDIFCRDFTGKPVLTPPYFAVKVSPALFHTQGGLIVDSNGQVKKSNGRLFPNLFAGGGAARGISGPSSWGYLAGNGLLTATSFGRLAGIKASSIINNI